MDKRTHAWDQRLTSEFNRRFYVRQAAVYRRRTERLDWATLLVGASAFVSLAASSSSLWTVLLSVAAAISAATNRAFRWSEKAASYQVQHELWSELRDRWYDIYDRLTRDEDVTDAEIHALDGQFSKVFSQHQDDPPKKLREDLQDEVERRFISQNPATA